jgi:hypothetical protein
MDDFSKRLGAVEVGVAEMRAQLPHLATKADVQAVRVEIGDVRVEVGAVRSDMNAMETRLIRWMVGTVISTAAMAFTIAKYVA